MVEAVRAGQSLRQVASSFGVSLSTVAHWVEQARGKRLDRVQFANCKPGRAWNRTSARVEQRILLTRRKLRDKSVLGEYGADAIGLALQEQATVRSPAPIGQGLHVRRFTQTGCTAWCGVRSTSRSCISTSMHCGGVIQPINRCFSKSLFLALINSSKAQYDCSGNAETLSHRCQKSVPSTLRLARLTLRLTPSRLNTQRRQV